MLRGWCMARSGNSKHVRRWIWIFIAILSAFLGQRAEAQIAGATLSGIVTDQTGAAVPAAKVSIMNQENGDIRDVITNRDGVYSAPSLLAGEYQVTVSATGFSKLVQEGVKLTVGAERTLDLSLKLGQVSETVAVTDEIQGVEVSSPTLSSVVAEKAVEDLTLNGRSWTQHASLKLGVSSIRPHA